MFYNSILVTGGAGFIGSHTTLELLRAGFKVVVADNLSNSSYESLRRVSQIVGCEPVFLNVDVRDRKALNQLFKNHSIDAVLHFAGLKAVGESVSNPLDYYDNNVHGSQVLLSTMAEAGIFKFIFSSSATVYGETSQIPISEDCPVGRLTNPYGRSKLMVEDMLRDLVTSDPRWRIAVLRYFNPVGAHESGLIGEHPRGVPNNLLPYLAQVAVGKLHELSVFGNDYPTKDGTGVRDYIHVMDLAEGHLCALTAIQQLTGFNVWNLGTGQGYSVLEIIEAFERVSGREIPYKMVPRRPGDIATCYADPNKAQLELGWVAKRNLEQMLEDAWRWQYQNPNGFN
ncbi:MAG: UDP-glucose 4-epimerase GalE [Sutterellaceae bacterium]|uniref:UDP-glucose 4-epimerase GalE n=1 Tax=unclassified Limnobacter TaxID=2630203 RepID=UPI000C52397D|nr:MULTISPECIES: UDP-glucose 4-epimerase GalE [unclassified Limnobacter]MAG79425.1 UDP-glucose 4-epimerase GalE [Sutterellaceae bacterium]MBT84234.1 UDP-glucose 4-epimerase GalE [Sutterellaceae bacterium]|tara:strand:- start:26227 stop:27249 length:1023 start_codon:yes stop_codon:yes gene_type:complete